MLARRLEFITKILEREGSVSVADLSKKCNVTEKTIRQDLIKLEEMNIAIRVHGGAMPAKDNENGIYPITSRKIRHAKEKQQIAREAYKLIEEGDTVILDSGTTTLELAKLIDKYVIVLTNDPYIANELAPKEMVTLFTTGGQLKRERGYYIYVGQDALRTLKNYRAKKCFIGASGLDFINGLSVFSTEEAEIKRTMIKSSQERICLMDYNKFHKIAFTNFAQLNEIDTIITDSAISDNDINKLKELNVGIMVSK